MDPAGPRELFCAVLKDVGAKSEPICYRAVMEISETRMHPSGMRTACLLIISQHALCRGVYPSMHWAGGCLPMGVSARGGVCPGGCLPGGCLPREGCIPACNGADTPLWTDRQL